MQKILRELCFHEYSEVLMKILLLQKQLLLGKLYNLILDSMQDKLSIMQKYLQQNLKTMDLELFLEEQIIIWYW